jgi:hypothetical protein
MSIDHTYEVCRDDSCSVSVNISGLNEDCKQVSDISASIYAYDSKTGEPKFTCQLCIEDLRQLHQHLSKYSIVTDAELTETGKFIEVKGNTEELLAILSAAAGSELLPALKYFVSHRLSKDDINTILGRKDSLDRFSQMLEAPDLHTEANWQAFFEENDWIFGYGLKYRYLQILQREAHISSTNLDGSNDVISDFLLSDTRFTKLVELKTPNTKLFENRRNRSDSWRLSTDLTDAVSQILAQKANWELEARNRNYDGDGNLIIERANDVECILVIGSLTTIAGTAHEIEIKLKTLELYRRNLRNIEIVLYDELLKRARFIVGELGV